MPRGFTRGTAGQGLLWEPPLGLPPASRGPLCTESSTPALLCRVNTQGSLLLPPLAPRSSEISDKSPKTKGIWHFNWWWPHSSTPVWCNKALPKISGSYFWIVVFPELDSLNKWPDGGTGQGGTTKKSTESLVAPLHFSDSTWAAQYLNQIVILKCKHGFRGFTPGLLPLEDLILDSQRKGKEKKEKATLRKIKSSKDSSKTVSSLQTMCLLTQASKSIYCIIKKVAI